MCCNVKRKYNGKRSRLKHLGDVVDKTNHVLTKEEKNTIERMLDKSQEAFIMAIEIYNRPSLKYRVEGFSFFICNAWELMTKAQVVKICGYNKLSYINKNGDQRTITLKKALALTITNKKSLMIKNLSDVIALRNTSTHFIVEEDNQIYLGLFQSCITNYERYMHMWHGRRIADIFPTNYLTLCINAAIYGVKNITAQYPDDVALALMSRKETISHNEEHYASKGYSCIVQQELVLSKKAKGTSKKVAVVSPNQADENVTILKKYIDPKNSHPYSTTQCISEINKKLRKNNVKIYVNDMEKDKFTSNDFQLFAEQNDYKEKSQFCYKHVVGNSTTRTYSKIVIEQIVDALMRNNKLIDELKELKRKRATQGAKEF